MFGGRAFLSRGEEWPDAPLGEAGSRAHGLATRHGMMRSTALSGWSSEDAVEAEVGVSRTCVFSFKRDFSISRLLLMGQVQALVGRDTVNSFCLQIWCLVPSLI